MAAFAAIMPVLMLLAAKAIGHRRVSSAVKDAPYESAEASSGTDRIGANEYSFYFPIFLSLEVLVVMVLAWVLAAKGSDTGAEQVFIALGSAFVLAVLGIYVAKARDED